MLSRKSNPRSTSLFPNNMILSTLQGSKATSIPKKSRSKRKSKMPGTDAAGDAAGGSGLTTRSGRSYSHDDDRSRVDEDLVRSLERQRKAVMPKKSRSKRKSKMPGTDAAGRSGLTTRSGRSYSHDDDRSSVDEDLVRSLERQRKAVMLLMDEAEEKQFSDLLVKEWLVELKHAIYDVDTLLDRIESEARFKKLDGEHGSSSSHAPNVLSKGIKKMIKRLVDLADDARNIGLMGGRTGGAAGKKRVPDDEMIALERQRNVLKRLDHGWVKKWLLDLEHTIYDANTLLANIETEVGLKVRSKAFGMSSSYAWGGLVQDAPSKISSIAEKLMDLANDGRQNMRLKLYEDRVVASSQKIQVLNSQISTSDQFSWEEEKERVMQRVLSSVEPPAVCGKMVEVIAITGMGGLGKTTLAQSVYNHAEVKACFKRSWARVSGNFDLVRVNHNILEGLIRRPVRLCGSAAIQQELEQELRGKRFLLVLDDLRDLSNQNWEKFIDTFSVGSNGSKIIVTTRDLDAASVVSADYTFDLKPMSEHEGWSLFSKVVFRDGGLRQDPELEAIGKEIVIKCQGLPLSIKTLGCLLRSERKEQRKEVEWERVRDSSLWQLPEAWNDIVPALGLSYSYLPSHLKSCFAYCSLFPKDYRFLSKELVDLWIDEGLVQPQNNIESLEDIGMAYFEDLLSRSFFTRESYYGGGYVMHDILQDLAQVVFADFHQRMDGTAAAKDCKKIRHVSFQDSKECDGSINVQGLAHFKSLWTIMTHTSWSHPRWDFDDKLLQDILLRQPFLRVLCLLGTEVRTLPDSIGNVESLRCLDVSHTHIKVLPASLGKLCNLRRLLGVSCDYLSELHIKMADFVSLRRLALSGKQLRKAPRNLNHLKECNVELALDGSNSGDPPDGSVDDAIHKADESGWDKLLLLVMVRISNSSFSYSVEGDEYDRRFSAVDHTDLLDSLRPHTELKEVKIHDFNGTRFPYWLLDRSYHNIGSMEFFRCHLSFGLIPALGQLPSLKYLTFHDIGNMRRLGTEFYDCNKPFGSLEELRFEDMKQWEDWEPSDEGLGGISCFPRLQKLHLLNCTRLKGRLPSKLPSLSELFMHNCSGLVKLCLDDSRFHMFLSLRRLSLEGCDSVESFPAKGSLPTSLTYLCIKSFPKLKRLDGAGLKKLIRLKELLIDDCPMLEALPEETALLGSEVEEHSPDDCLMLEAIPEESLPHSSDMEEDSSDDDEFHLSSLTKLSIENCVNLKRLNDFWLQSFPCLQELVILGCLKLDSLPEEELPRSLEVLRLQWNHPKVRERCHRDTGPDWPKIAHVPDIRIL